MIYTNSCEITVRIVFLNLSIKMLTHKSLPKHIKMSKIHKHILYYIYFYIIYIERKEIPQKVTKNNTHIYINIHIHTNIYINK